MGDRSLSLRPLQHPRGGRKLLRMEIIVTMTIPVNLLDKYNTMLKISELSVFHTPLKRNSNAFGEIRRRFELYSKSLGLRFLNPVPYDAKISKNTSLNKHGPKRRQLFPPSQTEIKVALRQNGIISFRTSNTFLGLPKVEQILRHKRNVEKQLLEATSLFNELLSNKLSQMGSYSPILFSGEPICFIYVHKHLQTKQRIEYIKKLLKSFACYSAFCKRPECRFQDEEFVVSGKSIHVMWSQSHIRKKTRTKLIEGILEAIVLSSGIDTVLKRYPSLKFFRRASEHEWNIFVHSLNPCILSGRSSLGYLYPANIRSWLNHCSRVYRLRDRMRNLLFCLLMNNRMDLLDLIRIYHALKKIIPYELEVTSYLKHFPSNIDLTPPEKLVVSLFAHPHRTGIKDTGDLECFNFWQYETGSFYPISVYHNWLKQLLTYTKQQPQVTSTMEELITNFVNYRKKKRREFGHFRGENKLFDPLSHTGLKSVFDDLVLKGFMTKRTISGRGRGGRIDVYAVNHDYESLLSNIIHLAENVYSKKQLFYDLKKYVLKI